MRKESLSFAWLSIRLRIAVLWESTASCDYILGLVMGRAARVGLFYHDVLSVGAIFISLRSSIMIDKLQVSVNKMVLDSHLGSFLGQSLIVLDSCWQVVQQHFATCGA